MQNLLNEVSSLVGVLGVCIFDKKDGVLCGKTREKLADGLQETVGAHLLRLFQLGVMSSLDIRTAQFFFDRYAVIGLPFRGNAVLIVLCTPQADCPSVAEAAVHLAAKLDKEPVLPVMEEQLEEVEPEEILDKELYSAQLQAVLCRIEQALAGAIGPVAGMVMQDYIDRWQLSGPTIPARIAELTNMLVEEIGDPEAAQDFVAKIEKII
ncbi:hypothetical protein [Candidatus Electronema sp. PJ]|uniref:hypothetical protein n=1 Tax=Candidatus Electronema sp. PJ TaxID=3401572 RepID=UPI003AA947FD